MAIIICIECGKEFSSFALACPNCNCPTEIILKYEKGDMNKKAFNNDLELIRSNDETIDKNVNIDEFLSMVRLNKDSKVLLIKEYSKNSGLGLIESKTIVDEILNNINWTKCPNCNADVFEEDGACFKCSKPVAQSLQQREKKIQQIKQVQNNGIDITSHQKSINIGVGSYRDSSIRCPKCGSNNYKVISGTSKAASWALLGPFAAGKILSKYHCQNCKHNY